MASDTVTSNTPGDDAIRIGTIWQSARRRRDDIDRVPLVGCVAAALDGAPTTTLEVAATAAAFGAAWAKAGRTINALVTDLDLLEAIWLDHLGGRTVPRDADASNDDVINDGVECAAARKVHVLVSVARRSAIAAFSHGAASTARKRIRLARHDILNAIGAVRNAVLLMDDRPAPDTQREQMQSIAKRNSFAAESLVRLHLSDGTAVAAAFGWDDLAGAELSDAADAPDAVDAHDATASPVRGLANVAALDTIVRGLRDAYRCGDKSGCGQLTITIASKGPGVGLLTVRAPRAADRADEAGAIDAIRRLSADVGVMLEEGSNLDELRFTFPLSAGDQRHDVGGAGQGYHTDAVRL